MSGLGAAGHGALRVAAVIAILGLGGAALAQPMPPGHPFPSGKPAQTAQPTQPSGPSADERAAQAAHQSALHDRALQGNSRGGSMFFWLFATLLVAGALFVITRSNLITAVMGMVGTFFAIAAIYAMLFAKFLAAIQVLVYAGAIMVLFVFVIMILNKPEAEPWSLRGLPGKVLAGAGLLYLFVRLSLTLWAVRPPATALAPPSGDFGSTHSLGGVLFEQYLFPFEAVSLVLLIAVVGAVAVARPHEAEQLPTKTGGES